MRFLLTIVIGIVVIFYLFFYIYGLIIISRTKRIAKECGYTKEEEREYQNAIRGLRYMEEQARQEELRRAIEHDASMENPD